MGDVISFKAFSLLTGFLGPFCLLIVSLHPNVLKDEARNNPAEHRKFLTGYALLDYS